MKRITIDKYFLKKVNAALELKSKGIPIKRIEEHTNCGIMHKLLPIINQKYGQITVINMTLLEVTMGMLREYERQYQKHREARIKGQRKIDEFCEWKYSVRGY